MQNKILRTFLISFLISVTVYTLIALTFVYWPIELEQNVESYDFSAIETQVEVRFGEERWIPMRDESELFSRVYESQSNRVMILIHGSGSESRYLSDLANAIADSNLATVITPDMRGHGRNHGTPGDIEFIGQLEQDVEDLIQFSRDHFEANEITLAGHSSVGGFVLRYVGNPDNEPVDSMVLLAPFLGYKAPTVKPNSGGWVHVALKRIIGLSMLNNVGLSVLNHEPVLFFNRPEHINDALQVPSYSYNLTMNFDSKNYQEEIQNITIPTLVLVGEADESFYHEQFPIAFEPAKAITQVEILNNVKHLDIVSDSSTFRLMQHWMKE